VGLSLKYSVLYDLYGHAGWSKGEGDSLTSAHFRQPVVESPSWEIDLWMSDK